MDVFFYDNAHMNDIRKLQAAIGRYHAPPGHMRLNVSTQRRRKAASAGATASAVTFAPASGSSPAASFASFSFNYFQQGLGTTRSGHWRQKS